MRVIHGTIVGLALLLSCLLRSGSAAAEEPFPAVRKIAVVDLDQVFQEYERTRASDATLDGLAGAKQQEREKKVSEIRSLREELVLLNQEGRVQKQGMIEEKVRQLASFDQEAREGLRKERDERMQGILKDIEEAVTAYAKEKGFDLVLTDRAVLYQMEAIDISKEIVTILNSRYAKKTR